MEESTPSFWGAGAARLFCRAPFWQPCRGVSRHIAVLDHTRAPGKRSDLSGGGGAILPTLPRRRIGFFPAIPRFCASALARVHGSGFCWPG